MSETKKPSPAMAVKNFFGVSSTELIAFKKADPEGYAQLAEGITNGTLTY